MELDEMKTAWSQFDDRLGRQETLSETFIREAIAARSQRSANKFLANEMLGAGALMVVIPLALRDAGRVNTPGAKSILLAGAIIMTVILVWQFVKIWPLFRIDMSKGVRDNIVHARRYELYAMSERRIAYILAPLLFLGAATWYAVQEVALWEWALLGAGLIAAALYSVWYYKKFLVRNMGAIKRGLEELKDL